MIRFDNVHKRYSDGTHAVRGLDFEVEEGTTTVLVGPSGCGKTTTMKLINRLDEPTEGTVYYDGTDVRELPATDLRRRIGYVIQDIGLFDHMTVGENVATVPELEGWDAERTDARVDELLELMGLPPGEYRDSYPAALSGGQQQRVGVARALAAGPDVMLMDEPFGALDPITREEMPGLLVGEVVLRLEPDTHLPSQGGHHLFHEVFEPLELSVSHITGAREASGGSQAVAVLGVVTPPAEGPEVRESLGTSVAARDGVIDVEVAGRERPPTVSTQVAVAFVHGLFHGSPLFDR